MMTFSLGNISWKITISDLISSLIFFGMGSYITYLAFNNQLFSHSNYQLDMNIYSAKILDYINGFVTLIPEYIWAILFVSLIGWFAYLFIKQLKNNEN